jgi:hypothetical protein
MARYLILAQSECTAVALGAWLELLGIAPPKLGDPRCILFQHPPSGPDGEVLLYEMMAERIEAAAKLDRDTIPLNEIVVLVDSIRPSAMSAVSEGCSWDALIATLILSFPEIKWVFGVVTGGSVGFPAEHSLAGMLTQARRDPLLDPTGLRDWVRQQTNGTRPDIAFELPTRLEHAAAVDDEKSYAYFHAYTAYRFGYRSDTITSWALMEELFRSNDNRKAHGFELLLEDMSLPFADKPFRTHLSRFDRKEGSLTEEEKRRANHCPLLDSKNPDSENSRFRVMVTTGESVTMEGAYTANRDYLKENKPPDCGLTILKPVGGMFDLWQKARLFKHLYGGGKPGNAPGFAWPCNNVHTQDDGAKRQGHGAPGKLMLISEMLIRRAETLRSSARTVTDFILGSVLATDAVELLGGETPTLTLAALALKHEFEVRAECSFIGVGYHFNVDERVREIQDTIAVFSKWFSHETRRSAKLNAVVVILNRLAIVFRNAGQFDEEHKCLVALRSAHREREEPNSLNPVAWTKHLVLSYIEWLLASAGNFVWAIVVWLVVLSFAWFLWRGASFWTLPGKDAITGIFSAFFSGTAAADHLGVSLIAIVAGAFHVGVFISFLYSRIVRR